MIYYRVKEDADLKRANIKKGYTFLVKDELYTKKEIENALINNRINENFVDSNFIKEDISPKKTYYFFGARFKSYK